MGFMGQQTLHRRGGPLAEAMYRATQGVVEEDLAGMALLREELPGKLSDFELAREEMLDNGSMAAQGFPGSTTGEIASTGRITGYLREFVRADLPAATEGGADIISATVVHLFGDPQQVSRWMAERFLREFRQFVGKELGNEQHLLSADPLAFDGFSDEAVGLRTLQTSHLGLVSSTVVDFRMGRLLGVAYLVSQGDVERQGLVRQMGLKLERRMVRVLLGSV